MVKSKIKPKVNTKSTKKNSKHPSKAAKTEDLPLPPIQKKGRQTNNSLASLDGPFLLEVTQNVIKNVEDKSSIGKQGKNDSTNYGYKDNLGIEEEEQQIGMHKILKILKDHEDAWPFADPVDEQYAPRYYSVVRKPMDLSTMEDKLDDGGYKTINQFKRDFNLIVENCKQYNGSDNEYTEMALNLKEIFNKAVDKFLEFEASSEDSLSTSSCNEKESIKNSKSKSFSPASPRHSPKRKQSKQKNSEEKSPAKISDKKSKVKSTNTSEKKDIVEEVIIKNENKDIKSKAKKVKNQTQEHDIEEKSEITQKKAALNSTKSKKTKVHNINSVSKNQNLSSNEVDDLNIKTTEKNKKVERNLGSQTDKELKENKKKKDIKKELNLVDPSKDKTQKVRKKQKLDILIDKVKKRKSKSEKDFLNKLSKKLENTSDYSDNEDDQEEEIEKWKNTNLFLKNGEMKTSLDDIGSILSSSKNIVKNIESITTKKEDIECLDGLKDRISKKRQEEKLKLELEKKRKKKSAKSVHVSKKVSSHDETIHDKNKSSVKKSKSKKHIKNEKKSQDDKESKKSKSSIKKEAKGLVKKEAKALVKNDIQALNQATEQTLNDMNKWLDDTPRVSEFSSDNDTSIKKESVSDTLNEPILPTTSVSTNNKAGLCPAENSRKRPKCPSSNTLPRPKKIQRTIDRLQPGKSKGNLLFKKPNSESPSLSESMDNRSTTDKEQNSNQKNDDEPKLSLGTVLKNVDSIQLICKSIISSPNTHLSNEDDEDEGISKSVNSTDNDVHRSSDSKVSSASSKNTSIDKNVVKQETPQTKTATPNLSAWFKAFGGPKSKCKKEEEENLEKKKDEKIQTAPESKTTVSTNESSSTGLIAAVNNQHLTNMSGCNTNESLSSFSQESMPSRAGHSPQQASQSAEVISPTVSIDPQNRGAGFYQDAMSTGSSPYNSPYYTTPPRYSAQLPPTPSPLQQPTSPAYLAPASYDQPSSPSLYSQISPNPQQLPQSNQISAQNQSSVCPAQSPRSLQTSPYPQSSPQPMNYSQSSPQTQPSTPQTPGSSYSQPSPSTATSLNCPQVSPQQQHSPYSQSSPQPLPNYSQPSPHSTYSQVSPRPPSSTYSQSSPQPPSCATQSPSPYLQSELVIVQSSPKGFSQTSPQTPTSYAHSSSQSSSPYSVQQSSEQQLSTYSQPTSQAPINFSALSSQHSKSYISSHSVQELTTQQPSPIQNFSQSSVQEQQQQQQQRLVQNTTKVIEENQLYPSNFSQSLKSAYSQSSAPLTSNVKSKDKHPLQHDNVDQRLHNQQIYQTPISAQFPPYPTNILQNSPVVANQMNIDSSGLSASARASNHDVQQQLAQQRQQNLSNHEHLYGSGFQASSYAIPNPACRPVYPGFFDVSSKIPPGTTNSSLPPVKKRAYEASANTNLSSGMKRGVHQDPTPQSQQQFGFEPLLSHSQFDSSNAFSSGLTDNTYARLSLGLVGHSTTAKDQQLLSIQRPDPKTEHLSPYARPVPSGQSDLELTLLQNLQNAAGVARKSPSVLPVTHQPVQPSLNAAKPKKTKKKKSQKETTPLPTNIASHQVKTTYSQFASSTVDSMGLKQSNSAFNFTTATSNVTGTAATTAAYYDKDSAPSAYAFLDDFRNPNLQEYYSMALRQQQQQQAQHQPQPQTNSTNVDESKLCTSQNAVVAAAARTYSGHPFLHTPGQRPNPYASPVPSYVPPHGHNIGVDPASYQQYIHSLYALPPPHHRTSWL
ncbi:hypothetical protein TKK_0005040 [Trichogramma kaykai]|uniref:Bromo domain-containing protein n=1 Tax=Trichogramma kaykai TaxID=54128 RepID=A0ABD2XIW9_9HYME